MPRFDYNPNDAVSGIPVYPKGSYEIELGEPKSFYAQGKNGKADNYGVRYRAKIAEGEYAGKPMIVSCYMHNEDSRNFSKAIQMAALGFMPRNNDSEVKFNEKHGSDDWTFNTDDNSSGDGWHKLKGQRLIVDLDVGLDDKGDQQQKTIGYRPLGS